MKVTNIEVIGLFGRQEAIRASLADDLNILTGRNGAGKTSILKLIWYTMSGNILLALKEVPFQKFSLSTTEYDCVIHGTGNVTCKIELKVGNEDTSVLEDIVDEEDELIFQNAEDLANPTLIAHGSSVFFLTFRRIEGGFILSTSRNSFVQPRSNLIQPRVTRAKNDVEEGLVALSRRLSNEPHIFVSAISTVDIVGLLLRQYADLSELSNSLQQNTS